MWMAILIQKTELETRLRLPQRLLLAAPLSSGPGRQWPLSASSCHRRLGPGRPTQPSLLPAAGPGCLSLLQWGATDTPPLRAHASGDSDPLRTEPVVSSPNNRNPRLRGCSTNIYCSNHEDPAPARQTFTIVHHVAAFDSLANDKYY